MSPNNCPPCPRSIQCKGADHRVVARGARRLFQCNACRRQTSVKAGTIFASSKLPLRLWFKAIYLVTQSKRGISSIELGRRLGVTQTAAWMMKHKLAQAMLERNASKRLKGNVQMDDAYIGGARSGRRGRGAAGKTPFVAAIATTDDGKPDQMVLRPVKAFTGSAIRKLASAALEPGAHVVSDGLPCFAAVAQAGCLHTRSRPEAASRRRAPLPSNGSIPPWAISKPRAWEPTAPCEKNTSLAISRSSNIASIADIASKP
jgi:transposase-like protein